MAIHRPKPMPGFEDFTGLSSKAIKQIPAFILSIRTHLIDNPVISPKIEKALGLTGIEVRAIVNFLRSMRVPIKSSKDGYCLACDEEQLAQTIEHLESRIAGVTRAVKGLRNADFSPLTVEGIKLRCGEFT